MNGNNLDKETRKRLSDQLIKLGDMMGDGLHHEPDGKWISKEYRKICIALGYIEKPKRRKPDNKMVDELMAKRVAEVLCRCGGAFIQTRSGSMTAQCTTCLVKATLLQRVRGKKK